MNEIKIASDVDEIVDNKLSRAESDVWKELGLVPDEENNVRRVQDFDSKVEPSGISLCFCELSQLPGDHANKT